jgi:hypothetical protein
MIDMEAAGEILERECRCMGGANGRRWQALHCSWVGAGAFCIL